MNVFAKFDEIPSMILQDIKETKRYGRTVGLSFSQTDGQCENSIPSHKHSLRGGIITKWHNSCNTDPSVPIFLQNVQCLIVQVW